MNLLFGVCVLSVLVSLSQGAEEKKCAAADIVFVLDSSRSIHKNDFGKEKEFVNSLVDQFGVGPDKTRIAALQFAYDVEVEFNFNDVQNAEDIKKKISDVEQSFGKTTYTHDALKAVRTQMFSPSNGARPGVPKICILLSDGEPTQREMTREEGKRLRDANITLLAIGVGRVTRHELEAIVTPPASEHFFFAENFDAIKNPRFQKLIRDKACDQKEEPEKTCQSKEADVVFVLDQSSSIWPEHFKEQLAFVRDVVDIFDISSGKTQVGTVVFSDVSDVVFNLNSYDNKNDIQTAVMGIQQTGGLTNTHLALELVLDQVFTKRAGYRSWAAHICIVITDGVSRVPYLTAEVAERAREQGIDMFAIGVGDKTDPNELEAIASKPSSTYMYEVNGYEALGSIKDILAYRTCKVKAQPRL